jgi:hypothetical protein
MYKEDRYSHVVPLAILICVLLPYLRHTTQMVIKEGKNPRLCCDASTTRKPTDIIMNQVTPVAREVPITITFGKVKIQLYVDIYNARISYPLAIILRAMGCIKTCFQFTQIHADLMGAFGFIANDYYNLATTMVFGFTTSVLSWEPFRCMIETLSKVYASQLDLLVKHKKYLDMIGWAELNPNTPITPLVTCKINTGIVSANGVEKNLCACIYVDAALLLRHSKVQILMNLATLIEAIFVVMGKLDTAVRQCPLAMDKWEQMIDGLV